MKLSIGIVTFESEPELLKRTIKSLLSALSSAQREYELSARILFIVNDVKAQHLQNVADLVQLCESEAPDFVEIVTLSGHGNIGYGAAQNKGLNNADSDYYLVLNPDVSFGEDIIVKCIRYLEAHRSNVMAVPQGYDDGDRYVYLSKRAPSVLVLFVRALSSSWLNRVFRTQVARYTYKDMLPSLVPQSITLASGCFMFCRTSALRAVDGFDERYFLYFEDFDLSFRLKSIGDIVELPDIKICHYGGDAAHGNARRKYHFVKSAIRFFFRYGWKRPAEKMLVSSASEIHSEINT